MFMTTAQADAYQAFQAARRFQLTQETKTMKTGDLNHARRALGDVKRQGMPPSAPTFIALQDRLARLELQNLERIERWGRELYAQGKHPMGSYRLGSPEDQAARRGYCAAKRNEELGEVAA